MTRRKHCKHTIPAGFRHDLWDFGCREVPDTSALAGNWCDPDKPHFEPPGPWECACGEMTTVTHWRHGADGVMFHAGPDAPPSDPAPSANFAGPGTSTVGPDSAFTSQEVLQDD